ncbi:MAG: hypothetical protein ABR553_04905 [Gammaproteobacteria bacterium]
MHHGLTTRSRAFAAAAQQLVLTALLIGAVGLLWVGSGNARAETGSAADAPARPYRVAVLYPDIGEPYSSVFAAIIQGIVADLGTAPLLIPISDRNAERLRTQLSAGDIAACITLGRTPLALLDTLELGLPIVRGAVLDPNIPTRGGDTPLGISLTPDPTLLLDQLKRLKPGVSRVTVVYSDARNQALIDRAVTAGQGLGLHVAPYKAEDLPAAAAIYKTLLAQLGPDDALWLPQDPEAIDDRVILPMLLNAAWKQGFVLFSSNAEHAKRGALYSVYPDNVALGRRLARIAARRAAGQAVNAGMQPLEDLLIAVNLRTAEHLRLRLSPEQINAFDLTFPQR